MKPILCDICKQPIAQVDPKKVHAPISGDQLHSPMPGNGVPSPFHDSLAWEFLKCPFCGFRPFLKDDEITVESEGKLELKPKQKPKRRKKK